MPVPTDTFRNQRNLHLIFAGCAAAMFGSVVWLVIADYNHAWRGYQRRARLWDTAVTVDAADRALTDQQKRQLAGLQAQVDQLQADLPHDEIAGLEAQLHEKQQARARLTLPAATIKGEIGPLTQQLERARLSGAANVDQLSQELTAVQERYSQKAWELAMLDQEISQLSAQVDQTRSDATQIEKEIDNLLRTRAGLQEKLKKIDPQTWARQIDQRVRNAPLLDWFNPTEKVQQVVVPDIRTDLNFLTVETIDRCTTCHVNIDNPAFERDNLMGFAERQVAGYEGQNVDSITRPVVLLGFWEAAADLAGLQQSLESLGQEAVRGINAIRDRAGLGPLDSPGQLDEAFDRIAKHEAGNDQISREQWYEPLVRYLLGVKNALRSAVGQEAYGQLTEMYRRQLIERFNTYRQQAGLPALSDNPVLLGHPRLDLYVDAESAHPMKTMGCTSCHEGSGQETDFHHTAHTPRDAWVDAQTGAVIPTFLLDAAAQRGDHTLSHDGSKGRDHVSGRPTGPKGTVGVAMAASEGGPVHGDETVGAATARSSHQDIKLTDLGQPAPFAPTESPHGGEITYRWPGAEGQTRLAVSQPHHWARAYGWHAVHYMEWEKPMHAMAYLQSSCKKCHGEIYDIRDTAPRLFEGRRLYGELGCVNCHGVDDLKDDLDIKKVGPSLVHLKHKLSAEMAASWIWAPRAFRPTSKMPHYFMLENNSSPVDILRTRTEVAAITHYLMKAGSRDTTHAYQPEPRPRDLTGDPEAGKKLFNAVGCLACHSNLQEHGQKWIVDDLVTRQQISQDQAQQRHDEMTYNQRHWYVMEHLPHKLERTGPELSGVGTKLTAGRDPNLAVDAAADWLYDWLRYPRHYSSYTIMPSFRLSPQEATDLTAYLLTLKRPDYEPADFLELDSSGKAMLAELVANLKAASSTLEMARKEVGTPDKPVMTVRQQLDYLGKKMISHYGCSGCHLISGFEDAVSACTNLDDWGLKDPHKLDFGYFDHAFDADRHKPITVWKVDHEGLGADAPQVTHHHTKAKPVSLRWESLGSSDRRPWLYQKLHNPRVYDRGRVSFSGELEHGARFTVPEAAVGKPYDKLKMPKFFLTDRQVRALITYVTSIRKPLVTAVVRQAALNQTALRIAKGRQVGTLYNCYGCHSIEGNAPQIWEYTDVLRPDGSYNYENLNNSPPRLLGQGAKTQPQWLHDFLCQVEPLRPWLKIRMPSFPLADDDRVALVDYFAGASQQMADRLAQWTGQIERYRSARPDDSRWYTAPGLDAPVEHLKAFAIMADLVRPKDLDPETASGEQLAAAWDRLFNDAMFQQKVNRVKYPFVQMPAPASDTQWFARGEALFRELRCYQCHALGNEEKLLELWKLDNPLAGAESPQDVSDDGQDDGYGDEDEGYGDEDEGYGDEDEGYGDEDEGYGDEDAAPSVPAGPVYSAPNLSLTANRLQWDWVDAWLQEPATIQPGTKMPQWFPGGRSAFMNYPGQAKDQMHAMYGYTGADQRRVLMDFIYEAGRRRYTPGQERLTAAEPTQVDLSPLPRRATQTEAATQADPGQTAAGDVTKSDPTTTAAPAPQPVTSQEPNVSSSIQLHDEATAPFQGGGNGRAVGVVRFAGKPGRRKPIRMGADAFCAKSHKGQKVLNESMIVNDDGSMRNVLIYVKSGLSGTFARPDTPGVLDQVGCIYRPHVLGMMAGQSLRIINSDNTLHNVKMNSDNNGSFNEGMPVAGMQLDKVISKPELGIPFKCDVHPWMGAVLHVLDHPFFCVSDVEGRYEISGLAPGTYTLEAVHESQKIPPVTFEVTVEADTSHRADVTLDQ